MKCIAVYTSNFDQFSDIYEEVVSSRLVEMEEKEIGGVTVSDSGDVPANYLDKMRGKPGVVVMKEKDRDITILQHGHMFEILLPESAEVAL